MTETERNLIIGALRTEKARLFDLVQSLPIEDSDGILEAQNTVHALNEIRYKIEDGIIR